MEIITIAPSPQNEVTNGVEMLNIKFSYNLDSGFSF